MLSDHKINPRSLQRLIDDQMAWLAPIGRMQDSDIYGQVAVIARLTTTCDHGEAEPTCIKNLSGATVASMQSSFLEKPKLAWEIEHLVCRSWNWESVNRLRIPTEAYEVAEIY